MNVADQLYRAARLYPDYLAFVQDDKQRTFRTMDERTNRLANALRAAGLSPGARVAILLENSIDFVEADFGIAKSGYVRVALNPRSTARDVAYILADAEAELFIVGSHYDELLRQVPADELARVRIWRVDQGDGPPVGFQAEDYETVVGAASAAPVECDATPDSLHSIFYTSGTTGKPKGVMLTHSAVLHVTYNLLLEYGPVRPGHKILLMQPLSHGGGFFLLPWYISGGCSVIMKQFEPRRVLELARDWQIETIKLVPTMLQRILRLPDVREFQLPNLYQIIYGASPMPPEQLREAISIFGPKKFAQLYGQAEAPMTITVLPLEDHVLDGPHPERLASAGRPWRNVEVRVVDDAGHPLPPRQVGEVVVRGPHMMKGYWKNPELTAATIRNGWLHTRDMGYMDEHGYVYLIGRKDEMINSGGHMIAPAEVENVLYEFPDVAEAAVIGAPDPEWGQAVTAFVVLKPGSRATADDIIAFSREKLGFKRPKRVFLLPELPKTPNGKINKTALAEQLR